MLFQYNDSLTASMTLEMTWRFHKFHVTQSHKYFKVQQKLIYLTKHLAYFRRCNEITFCSKHITTNVESKLGIRQNFFHILCHWDWATSELKNHPQLPINFSITTAQNNTFHWWHNENFSIHFWKEFQNHMYLSSKLQNFLITILGWKWTSFINPSTKIYLICKKIFLKKNKQRHFNKHSICIVKDNKNKLVAPW